MSDLKRYAVASDGRAFPDAEGNWVFHEDAAQLRAELARLKADLADEEARTMRVAIAVREAYRDWVGSLGSRIHGEPDGYSIRKAFDGLDLKLLVEGTP